MSIRSIIVAGGAAAVLALALPPSVHAQSAASQPPAASQPAPSSAQPASPERPITGSQNPPVGTTQNNDPANNRDQTTRESQQQSQPPQQQQPQPPPSAGSQQPPTGTTQSVDPNNPDASTRQSQQQQPTTSGAVGTSGTMNQAPSPRSNQTAGSTQGTTPRANASTADPNQANGRSRRLPATASPLPFMMLASFGSFAAAGVARALRGSLK